MADPTREDNVTSKNERTLQFFDNRGAAKEAGNYEKKLGRELTRTPSLTYFSDSWAKCLSDLFNLNKPMNMHNGRTGLDGDKQKESEKKPRRRVAMAGNLPRKSRLHSRVCRTL